MSRLTVVKPWSLSFARAAVTRVRTPELAEIYTKVLQLKPGQDKTFEAPAKYRTPVKIEQLRRVASLWLTNMANRTGAHDRWFSITVSTKNPSFITFYCNES